MLVIPGSTARLITDRFVPMLAVSVGVSLVGTLTGLYASYYADVSPGGAVVVTQGILFAPGVRVRSALRSAGQDACPPAQHWCNEN